ncbi:MAG: tyrosine-type recombinase/integrase [Chloroflexota bacterium]|nr:tyrosine-type recombinase/integrase [Chloroflexota bacterium]
MIAIQADGLSRSSVRWYSAMLKPLGDHFRDLQLADVTTALLRRYVVGLRTRDSRYEGSASSRPEAAGGLSDESVSAHIRALHRFWNWATIEYRLQSNPMLNIKRPSRRSPQPKGIDLADLRALFAATGDDIAGCRDRAIMAFLIDTGCRAQGLTGLELARLDMSQRRAVVIEKGKRTRTVFFTDRTAALLEQWAAVRPSVATTVFCSLGPRVYGKPLSYEGLTFILDHLKTKAGVAGRVNPHSFRHAFARQYIMNGGDLATLSQLMGHSDSTVTSWYYAVFTDGELSNMHDRFSPAKGVLDEDKDSND